MNLKILLLRVKLKTYFATCRGILRGLAPLGEGVADKPTKRKESALLAGAIIGATWLGSEGFAQRARRCEVSSDTFPSLQKIF